MIKIFQMPVRVAIRPLSLLQSTQVPVEVMYHPPNLVAPTQICIEVMFRPRKGGAFYTDQAAQSNFAG